ncbi:MAG: hypothetical protein R3Y47_02810 [Lachnospiraceae bacterium]
MNDHIKKYLRFYKAAMMALLPLVLCVITSALQGFSILDVYIPASEWNDELFYFKQVESIIEYGFPYGYFGFNESYAKLLSFAAWSPVLVWPWLVWGLLFGWNLLSPIYANIAFMMISMFVFVWIVKPTWQQLCKLAILYSLFTPFTRYMMSAMPECICFGMLIIFFASAIAYLRQESRGHLIALFVNSSLLTLMRPYLIVFMVLPICFWIYKHKWKGALGSAVIIAITGAMYAWIKVYLGAEYFTELYNLSWVKAFFTDGIFGGIRYTLYKLYVSGWDFFGKCYQGFTTGLASGAYFIGFLVVLTILLVYTGYTLYKKNYKHAILYGHLAFSFIAMWVALLLMYKMTEGSKHLVTFIAVGIFALAMMEVKKPIQIGVASIVFIYLYMVMAIDPYDYQVPYRTDELVAQIEQVEVDLDAQLVLETDQVPTFDNTVIWVFSDLVLETYQVTDWQILYSLPVGFGVSCSYEGFIIENFDELASKYICIVQGGVIEQMCIERDLTKITSGIDSVIYQLRD